MLESFILRFPDGSVEWEVFGELDVPAEVPCDKRTGNTLRRRLQSELRPFQRTHPEAQGKTCRRRQEQP